MSKIPTWLLSLFIIALWGVTFPALKLELRFMAPLPLAAWRVLPAGVVVCGWALVRRDRLPSRLWLTASVSALFNVVTLYGGQIAASAYLSPGITAGLLYLQPVLVTLFARLWLKEPLSAIKLTGISIGIIGVGLITFSVGAHVAVLGVIFAVSAALGWALGTVYVKARPGDSSIWFVGLQFILGGSLFEVVNLVVKSPAIHWTPVAFFDLLYIIIGGTAGAWILWIILLSRGQASRVSTYLFGVPALASLIGIIGFGEPLNVLFVGGFVAVSASILLVNGRLPKNVRQRATS